MKAVLAFFLRNAMLYALLFAALVFYVFAWPDISEELSSGALRDDAMDRAAVVERLATYAADQDRSLARRKTAIEQSSADQIARRLDTAKEARSVKVAQRDSGGGWLDSVRPSKILERKRLELEIAALNIEIDVLTSTGDARAADAALRQYARIPTAEAIAISDRLCERAGRQIQAFDRRAELSRTARNLVFRERRQLVQTRGDRCAAAETRQKRREAGLAANRAAAAARQALASASAQALPTAAELADDLPRRALRDIAIWAGAALLLILTMPLLIRLFFWFVLAPFAERREAIRMNVPGGKGTPISVTAQSAVSVAVMLAPGEELLVRQGFLQTSAQSATKATQFLLDWRHPLSSLASGMRFLTRLRGDGSATTVSAAHDPFAEVTLLTLPPGASCVLQPRALAAVAQPQGQPITITSHWRLFSLHAWLTLQLRYLVFHGPARLVITGSRGIRAESADTGRIFAPDQLVGFSANLGYAVRRNETFWPYFTGIEPLLRDRVTDGDGILLLEETPSVGRGKGGIRGGLEGAVDSLLKAFGI